MTLLRDTRYGLRMMTKKPVTSSMAILSLAVGLGASATIFSFVNALLLRPLPVPESDRLIEIWHLPHQSAKRLHALSHAELSRFRLLPGPQQRLQ